MSSSYHPIEDTGTYPRLRLPEPAHSCTADADVPAPLPRLPPIRTGFGSPIKGSMQPADSRSDAPGNMAHSASFSEWVGHPDNRLSALHQPPQGHHGKAGAKLAATVTRRRATLLAFVLLAAGLLFMLTHGESWLSGGSRHNGMQAVQIRFAVEPAAAGPPPGGDT